VYVIWIERASLSTLCALLNRMNNSKRKIVNKQEDILGYYPHIIIDRSLEGTKSTWDLTKLQ
jgi:hypothetical protein